MEVLLEVTSGKLLSYIQPIRNDSTTASASSPMSSESTHHNNFKNISNDIDSLLSKLWPQKYESTTLNGMEWNGVSCPWKNKCTANIK